MAVMRLDNRFQFTLLFGEFVKIRIRIGVQRVHFIQTGQGVFHFCNRFFNRFTDSVFRIQFRFLRQIADVQAGCGRASPSISVSTPAMMRSRVDLPAPFRPRTPILAPQRDIFQYMTLRRHNFADTVHRINVLSQCSLPFSLMGHLRGIMTKFYV